MDDIGKRLDELVRTRSPLGSGRMMAQLKKVRGGIAEARCKGFSYREITRLLGELGVHTTHQTVAKFCKTELKERASKYLKPQSALTARPQLGLPREGFRVALDEEL